MTTHIVSHDEAIQLRVLQCYHSNHTAVMSLLLFSTRFLCISMRWSVYSNLVLCFCWFHINGLAFLLLTFQHSHHIDSLSLLFVNIMCCHACPCGIYPFLHPFSPREDDWHPTVLVRNAVHTCDNDCGWNTISGFVIICVWISMGHTKVNVKQNQHGGDMVGLSSLSRTRREPPATSLV